MCCFMPTVTWKPNVTHGICVTVDYLTAVFNHISTGPATNILRIHLLTRSAF